MWLTAEGTVSPRLDFHSDTLAGQDIGLHTVTQSFHDAVHGTNIKHTIGHIRRWVDLAVAGFERAVRCTYHAAGVWSPVFCSLVLLTHWTLSSTSTTHEPRQVERPCPSELVNVGDLFAIGKSEIIIGLVVVVTAKATHLSLIRGRHNHLNIVDCVIEDRQPKLSSDNYIETFLCYSYKPISQG